MIQQTSKDIITDELSKGAYIHDEYTGFKEDYLTLHCLLRIYKPKTIFEVGTNCGEGINVMATALPEAHIYSLDLDYETMCKNSLQYPLDENGKDRVGSAAQFPYTQLRGDSMTFDYSAYPCKAYYIDGEHDTLHSEHETREALNLNPKIIILHDTDMPAVWKGLTNAYKGFEGLYNLVRVTDTRISYFHRISQQ